MMEYAKNDWTEVVSSDSVLTPARTEIRVLGETQTKIVELSMSVTHC